MKFGPVALEEAEGKLLAHNVAGSNGRRAFRKGTVLTRDDVASLRELGRSTVYVADLDEGDVDENSAARAVADVVSGAGLKQSEPVVGRVNLTAESDGVLRVDVERLLAVNECEGITVATLMNHSVVGTREVTTTIKIIPFAVPQHVLAEVQKAAAGGAPLISLDVLNQTSVGFILSGSPAIRDKLMQDFVPLRERIEKLGSEPLYADFVPLNGDGDHSLLAGAISRQLDAGAGMIILAGETAVMDAQDFVPRAVEQAGGQVECVGAPVEPGNLLMLAYAGEVPILGAPGCARSRKRNVVDGILPRLLAGERLGRRDIVALAHGGLLREPA